MAVDQEAFKKALSRFASGVTVVTVSSGTHLHGMTASAFASVSLEPPLVLICLDKTSRTLELIRESGSFAINILRDDQAELAGLFAQRGNKPFDSYSHRIGGTGAPILDDAITWIECDSKQSIEAGDHEILIGEVLDCGEAQGAPLVYYERAYRGLSGPNG